MGNLPEHKYKIKFNKLTVINIPTRAGISTTFQAVTYKMLQDNKKVITWDLLVQTYIDIKGDNYTPKFIDISSGSIALGDPSKISYHYKHQTIEWHNQIKGKIRSKFVTVFGQLVMNGMIKVQPKIKE
jgi:hypothetical protein